MLDINLINFFKNKKIIAQSKLSDSFNILTAKITLEDNANYVIKKYTKKNNKFNAILSEGNSLKYMNDKFPKLFPEILYLNRDILIMEYIANDNIRGNNYENQLAKLIGSIHSVKNDKFGFDFDTPIGGLKQPCNYSNSWVEFYKEKRLGMIFELINKNNPMPKKINLEIEKILKNIENYLPNNIIPRLIHGDLWDGNILHNRGKICGLIDPGIYFAHSEMEIAYLTWFKYISNNFINIYSEIIPLEKNYFKYEAIYQLYYCLLNVYLWSREYIKNTFELVEKINQ